MKALILVSVIFLFTSCNQPTIDEEVKVLCDCYSGVGEELDCNQLMDEIIIKYEFDPEAVSQIRDKVQDCIYDESK